MAGMQSLAPLMGFMKGKGQMIAFALGLLVLRLVFGLTLAFGHGLGKLTQFEEMSGRFMDFMGLGSSTSLALCIFAEFFCALALALGLFTRLAVIPLIVNMSVAFFIAHGGDPFQKKEMALLFLGAFVAIFLAGPGRFSLDGLIWGRNNSSRKA